MYVYVHSWKKKGFFICMRAAYIGECYTWDYIFIGYCVHKRLCEYCELLVNLRWLVGTCVVCGVMDVSDT